MTDEPPREGTATRRGRSSIVWTEHADLAPRLLALPDAEFAAELAARFGDFLGAIEPIGPRFAYPLSLMQAERYVARRLALVGEAAHVIHPIAGQGPQCRHARHRGARRGGNRRAPPRPRYRRRQRARTPYQRWRRLDAVLLAGVTDGLNRLFSNAVAPDQAGARPRPRRWSTACRH